MTNTALLEQISAHLENNCCFLDTSQTPAVAAQWTPGANSPGAKHEYVYECADGNPQRVVIVRLTTPSAVVPVVLAEFDPERPESYSKSISLSLKLADHGVVIDPCDQASARYPSPLKLLSAAAGQPRMIYRGRPAEGGTIHPRPFDNLVLGSIDERSRHWVERVRLWEADNSSLASAHLVSLASNLANELGWGPRQRLLAWLNFFQTTSARESHLRRLYIEVERSLRQRAKLIPRK